MDTECVIENVKHITCNYLEFSSIYSHEFSIYTSINTKLLWKNNVVVVLLQWGK